MWTENKLSYLLENYFKCTNTQLSKELGVSLSTIKRKAAELGLSKPNKINWTDSHDKELINLYEIRTTKQLAEHFNVSMTFIKTAIRRLGLSGKGSNKWTDYEDETLVNLLAQGHTYKDISKVLTNRSKDSICKRASLLGFNIGIKNKTSEQFEKEIKSINPSLVLVDQYINSKTRLMIKDTTCGHEWLVVPETILHYNYTAECRQCNPIKISKGEKEIRNILPKDTLYNNRTILNGKELDIYIPSHNIAIEYNGEYWHSNKISKTTLLEKTEECNTLGIKLIHIFEHEWFNKKNIVISRINSALGNNTVIYARKCNIIPLQWKECSEFLNHNHLQGAGSPCKYNIGLLYNYALVAVMTFNIPRFNNNYDYELVRYCSALGTNIIGGAGKLLNYFIKLNRSSSIISYSDVRWGNGGLYKKLGFTFSNRTKPSYFYFKNFNIINRYKAQKHNLKLLFPEYYSDNLTESEIMNNAGYYKVYDCGNDVWIKKPLDSI